MFDDYSDTQYSKLDSSTSLQLENDENLPDNFQSESLVVDKKEDLVNLFSDDLIKANISLSHGKSTTDDEKENDESPNQSNDFCDAECGEPITPQQLTFDFTMSNEDTEFSQKKCCDFWNFIYTMPNLKDLMVIPEPEETDSEPTGTIQDETSVSKASHITPYAPAVDFFLNRKIAAGPVGTSFVAKQPPICMNKDYLSYCHGSCVQLEKNMMEKLQLKETKVKSEKKLLPAIEVQPTRKSFLTKLCSQMDAWDVQHPKSFDQPHHAPALKLEGESTQPAQYVSPSVASSKEMSCTSDMTCVPCPQNSLEVDLVKKEE